MSERMTWWWAPLATTLVVGAGCNRTEPAPDATVPAAPAAGQASARPEGVQPDSWLTTQVQARFFDDAVVRSDDVDVSTENGVVTLTGTVRTEQVRTQAATLAQQVDGVTRVDNQLTVRQDGAGADGRAADGADRTAPPQAGRAPATVAGRLDAGWTTTKIQAQYFADPDVKGRNIDVTTDAAGIVTLRGRVDSDTARAEAVRIARETEGVRRVVDELRVAAGDAATDADGARSASAGLNDGWITAKIQSKYFLDPDVKARDIDVTTRNGVVTLSGAIDSPAVRRQAVDLARNTDGVQRVDDRLTLHAVTALAGEPKGPGAALETPTDPSAVMNPPDSWITTTVQSKFFLADELRGENIEVTAARGVVTLRGRVASPEHRDTAESIARGTRGVRRVANQLMVGGTDE